MLTQLAFQCSSEEMGQAVDLLPLQFLFLKGVIIYVHSVCLVPVEPRRELRTLALEPQAAVSWTMDAWN